MATPRTRRNLFKVHKAIINVLATDMHPNVASAVDSELRPMTDLTHIAPEIVGLRWKEYCLALTMRKDMFRFPRDTDEAIGYIINDTLNPLYY